MLTIYGGRSHALWSSLESKVAQARNEGRRCLLIVPEQYTLQAEKDLLTGLCLKGFFDIDVLSYSRFIKRLFLLYNPSQRKRVDDNGKNIAMACALLKIKKNLHYYNRSAARKGFITQVGEWIADIKRADISPDQLTEYAASLKDSAYKDKICDLSAAYAAYAKVLSGKFVDGEDVLASAVEAVPASGVVSGRDVFVYGFDLITDDFARLLCAIAASADDVSVYLAMDREDAPDGDCFSPVRASAERLRSRLKACGQRREWLWLPAADRDIPEDLNYLEKNLLRPSPAPYQDFSPNLSIFTAPTPFSEVHYIAQQVITLLDQGEDPDSICVLCGDMTQYAPLFETIFHAYGIPAYVALKEPLSSHGLTRLLLSAVRAVTGRYRQEDMLSLLKSGFLPLEYEEIWVLENYVIRYGISGERWHKPFVRGSETEREIPEKIRQIIAPSLALLQQDIREARSGAQSVQAMMDYLIRCNAYQTLIRQEESLIRMGFEFKAVQSRQVWSHILSLFEQMNEIAGESRIPGSVMTTWLEAGLIDEELSSLPPASGTVMVGEIGNLIARNPHTLFACGLNSALDESHEKGLLSPEEKTLVSQDMHAYLGMTQREHDRMAELDLWKVFSSPTKQLYLSYAQASQAGTALRPAQMIATIRRLFPVIQVYGGVDAAQGALHPLAPLPALDEIGMKLRSGTLSGAWLESWKWLLENENTRPIALSLLSAARGETVPETLPSHLAQSLFTDRIVSISRLESFAACPYSHFVQYGLKPQERKTWQIERSETGVFYHAAMEGFTRALAEDTRWPNITRSECNRLMDAALTPLVESWQDEIMTDSARTKAEGKRYINVCKRVAWAFTKSAVQSSFRPAYNEVAFGYPGGPPALKLNLDDGTTVYVRGRIDRVDRFETDESVYLRIVDYKSGAQTLDPARIWMGTQLQLLLYLEAMLHSEPDAIPAGAFYQWMGDPLIDQKKKGLIESEIAKKLCLKGIMLSDVQVIEWMDNGKPPLGIEDVLKKDGTVKKGKLACSLEELHALIQLAHDTAVKLTQDLRSGSISASPVCDKSNIAHCKFCKFAGVCRRDAETSVLDRSIPDVKVEDLVQKAQILSQNP